MAKPKKTTVREARRAFAKRALSGVREVLAGKLGGFAYYPTKETPKGREVAVFAATGPLAVKFARWARRSS
jgi:hypothetical protein